MNFSFIYYKTVTLKDGHVCNTLDIEMLWKNTFWSSELLGASVLASELRSAFLKKVSRLSLLIQFCWNCRGGLECTNWVLSGWNGAERCPPAFCALTARACSVCRTRLHLVWITEMYVAWMLGHQHQTFRCSNVDIVSAFHSSSHRLN